MPTQIDLDLQDLEDWADSNHLKLNPSKCKVMQVCFKRNPPCPPDMKIADKGLELVTETKLLGLTVQSYLRWDSQVNDMVCKSSRRLYMLGRLKRFGVPVEDLVSVYVGYVRPSVEYASPVWHGCISKQQTHQIERIQKRACHVILGNNYTTYTDALDLMGLQTLEDRRDQLCTNFAVKCSTSDRYAGWFPHNNNTHSMGLRNATKYMVPKHRTKRYGNSAIPFLTKLLNQSS